MIGLVQRRIRHAKASWVSWYDGKTGPDLVPPDSANDLAHTVAKPLTFGGDLPQSGTLVPDLNDNLGVEQGLLASLGDIDVGWHNGDDTEDDVLPFGVDHITLPFDLRELTLQLGSWSGVASSITAFFCCVAALLGCGVALLCCVRRAFTYEHACFRSVMGRVGWAVHILSQSFFYKAAKV